MTVFVSRVRRAYLHRCSLKRTSLIILVIACAVVGLGLVGHFDRKDLEKSAQIDSEIWANAGSVQKAVALNDGSKTYLEFVRGGDN